VPLSLRCARAMRLAIAPLLLLLAQALAAQSILFVASEPFGASVYIDGELQEGKSPLLLRGLSEGKHSVKIIKEGFLARELKIELPATQGFACALSPAEPLMHIDGEEEIRVAGKKVEEADGGIRLSTGTLTLRPTLNGIDLTPVFGGQKLIDGLEFALPLFLGLSGVLAVREIVWPRESALLVAPELVASSLIGGGLVAWDIVLEAEKKKFLASCEAQSEGPEILKLSAKLKFDEASETMVRGDFQLALERFAAIAEDYPESSLAPRALFELARLKYITGDKAGAVEDYRRIVEVYPVIELYDRALKALADCLAGSGDKEGAKAALDRMTFCGPGFSREEIESYRRSIDEAPSRPEPTDSPPRSP
jgi:tetratricopeptide (TPR) repeat protein